MDECEERRAIAELMGELRQRGQLNMGKEWWVLGRVAKFGDHVDTDAIIPGQFCHLTTPATCGHHCLEFVRPGFRAMVDAGHTIVLAGNGWGTGSSREHAVWALQGAGLTGQGHGVQLVLARSIAPIHRRNLVNDGVAHAIITAELYAAVAEGDELLVEVGTGFVLHRESGREFEATPPQDEARRIMWAGGLVAATKRR